jgi:hypothetical protein
LGRFLKERQQVGALPGVLDAGERHLIAGYEMLRISQ